MVNNIRVRNFHRSGWNENFLTTKISRITILRRVHKFNIINYSLLNVVIETSPLIYLEPTEDITVFSSRKINGGVVAGALIVVILTLILIVVIILGVVWIIKKKKVKESYGLFE